MNESNAGAVAWTDGLVPDPSAQHGVPQRLLKYSDIRRNDPRENREALRDLIVGELADELQSVRKAERERCIAACVAIMTGYGGDPAGRLLSSERVRMQHQLQAAGAAQCIAAIEV
jgi:hypothetical protein